MSDMSDVIGWTDVLLIGGVCVVLFLVGLWIGDDR